MSYATVTLKKGKEKPVRERHPWIFSGALAKEPSSLPPGSIVDVLDVSGHFMARGYYNHHSQIRVRLLTWNQDEIINEAFWECRLSTAFTRRRSLFETPHTNAFRIVHAESDGLPGLIIDRYDGWLVFQALTAGIDRHIELITERLTMVAEKYFPVAGVFERSDEGVRSLEGLTQRKGPLHGYTPPASPGLIITENGMRLVVDIVSGHKTGFYLDQRASRSILKSYSQGKTILNCFSYTGGFSVAGFLGGAKEVTSVDSSGDALSILQKNLELNFEDTDICHKRHHLLSGDVFQVLREFRQKNERFDCIILDPPKFATNTSQIQRACRGYKDINLLAFQLLKPGGSLLTFSCSGLISTDLFQKVVAGAALDAGVNAQILKVLGAGDDHPILLSFPESSYLKGFLIAIEG